MHIQTRIDPVLLDAVREVLNAEGISISEYLRRLVEQDLESRGGIAQSPEDDGVKSES